MGMKVEQIACVTSAGKGIGEIIAVALAARGAKVAVSAPLTTNN